MIYYKISINIPPRANYPSEQNKPARRELKGSFPANIA
jgi:hypothetical protein